MYFSAINPILKFLLITHHIISRIVGLSLGVTYLITTFQSRKARHWFLIAAAPMRLLGAVFFWEDGNRGTALWDAGNGALNLAVVLWETRRTKGQ